MKKWAWLWLIATLIDAGFVIFQAISANGVQPEIVAFDFSRTLSNITYWLDSVWYVFNILCINIVFAWFGYLIFKMLKNRYANLPNFSLSLFLYLVFGSLMVLANERFNIIYPSYLYHPFNIDSIEESLWMLSIVIIFIAALGYLAINIKYWKHFLLLYVVFAGLSYYPYLWGSLTSAKEVKTLDKPNVVYILLDAVRPDHMVAGGAPFDIMPKLNKMIKDEGVFYEDVTVSVGRSFSSAVAILSGLHAINNGARDNMFAKEGITYNKTLAHILKKNGYQTIAVNDAIQFWNIDQDYGFDNIWSAGTSSIKLIPLEIGGFMPLPLLFANTRVGELLFPYSYSDRNIDDLYETSSYVGKIERNLNFLDNKKPLFFFMSMELTHTPYADMNNYSSSIVNKLSGTDYYDACNYFLSSMNVLDEQLFETLDLLKKFGRLDNTLLIIGSDHGQGFSMAKDMYITHDNKSFNMIEAFYGNNGVNQSSTNLMLSLFSFLPNKKFTSGIRKEQIESIDIMPTILELLGIDPNYKVDGRSFGDNLVNNAVINEKTRFVESGFKSRPDFKKGQSSEMVELTRKVKFDLNTLTQEWNSDGMLFVELNKDRAVYLGNWALMTQDVLGSPYIFNRKEKIVWPIALAPSDVPVEMMLNSWCKHYSQDIAKLAKYGVTKETIAQGYCANGDKKQELFAKIKNNEAYDSDYYRSLERNVTKGSQFICTREHLY